jgi:hypothetical protein
LFLHVEPLQLEKNLLLTHLVLGDDYGQRHLGLERLIMGAVAAPSGTRFVYRKNPRSEVPIGLAQCQKFDLTYLFRFPKSPLKF